MKASELKPLNMSPPTLKSKAPTGPSMKSDFKASVPDMAAPPSKYDLPRQADVQLRSRKAEGQHTVKMQERRNVPDAKARGWPNSIERDDDSQPVLFYFSRDANIHRLKYFDT